MGLSDFPHPFVAVVLLADSQRGPRRHSGPNAGPPGSRVCLFRACAGSQTTQGRNNSCDDDLFRVAFRAIRRRRPPNSIFLSRLNTQPTRCPVNASPLPSRTATHDSGPTWFATPWLGGTCTRETYRFVPAHRLVKILERPAGQQFAPFQGVPSIYSSARPEPDRSPICRDYACMISSFVRARPWARPQTQTLSC